MFCGVEIRALHTFLYISYLYCGLGWQDTRRKPSGLLVQGIQLQQAQAAGKERNYLAHLRGDTLRAKSMKLNERSMAHYATSGSPADCTGYLYKRGVKHTAYQKRWFVLKGNLLFYFEEQGNREPVGVVVLEGCTIELCHSNEEHAFCVRFDGPGSRSYILAAESQEEMECWVKALSRASFDYMRLVVRELEKQLELMQKTSIRRKPARHRGRSRAVSRTKWENSRPSELSNGFLHPEDSNLETVSRVSGNAIPPPLPPPLPPRRRGAVWVNGASSASMPVSLESPVCPGTFCFSKLHEWYGKEVEELRKAWQKEQRSENN